MKRLLVVAGAVALAVVWTVGPAPAGDLKDKAETARDSAAARTERAADKAQDKAEGARDTIKDKAESARDTIKDKAHEAKVKIEHAWDRAKARTEAMNHEADVRGLQQALKDKGFDPGPIDGKLGPRTAAALRRYQQHENLPVTGRMDDRTTASLGVSSPSASPAAAPRGTTTPPARQAGS
jgi:peptidoglycan hydrolase-like protein with peptidoglycan-binding domain